MTPLNPNQVRSLLANQRSINDGLLQMQDRYLFDFDLCEFRKGWAQIDTRNDASYYGNWANPLTRQTVSYNEGDVRITLHDSDESFAEFIREWALQLEAIDYDFKIDGMCNQEIITAFEAIGLGDLLH